MTDERALPPWREVRPPAEPGAGPPTDVDYGATFTTKMSEFPKFVGHES
jgi:hypothetical protein